VTTEYPVDRIEATPRGGPASLLRAASYSERKAFEKAIIDGMSEAEAFAVLATTMGMKEGKRRFREIDRRLNEDA
jgi:hypothetical protein